LTPLNRQGFSKRPAKGDEAKGGHTNGPEIRTVAFI
jgi:hypothetical protein